MKYVVIDVETTGIDPESCQVIEIGAVIEDTSNILPVEDLPKFKCIVKHEIYSGSAFAINMNARIFKILEDKNLQKEYNILPANKVTESFERWLNENYFHYDSFDIHKGYGAHNSRINVAGKNFGVFDRPFLDKIPNWKERIRYHRRFIDPTMFYVDWKKDECLPDLNTCLERAGIRKEVSHDALEDAIDTLLCLRAKY